MRRQPYYTVARVELAKDRLTTCHNHRSIQAAVDCMFKQIERGSIVGAIKVIRIDAEPLTSYEEQELKRAIDEKNGDD